MAQSQGGGKGLVFSGPEMEFLAEDELVSVVPNFTSPPYELSSGSYGPFRPQIPVSVPIWLAAALKTRGRCTIQAPEWMTTENLKQVLENERDRENEFQNLPFHYLEISQLLFKMAPGDIPDQFQVSNLIEDIKDVRFHKLENGLQMLTGKRHAVKLNNLSAMELNTIRPFLTKSLELFFKLDKDEEASNAGAGSGQGKGTQGTFSRRNR